MSVLSYGDEDGNNLNNNDFEGDKPMENKICELMNEVETYRQAVQDAKDALASAEMELDEVLQQEYENQN